MADGVRDLELFGIEMSQSLLNVGFMVSRLQGVLT